eukprot:TRINITY_DN9846_c0_g1_i1.p2 TRINITY_DN9846_c0_g1~~TRINITY_DN9846_c0_g1_i1.p2  ORF type:complete len:108 (+),score=8.43 TRINITY_DN9846_c0_g1_i1:357-680(+)
MLKTPVKMTAICSSNNTPDNTKNGIRILTINGCTTIELDVIVSCQCNKNNMMDEMTNGNDKKYMDQNVSSRYTVYTPNKSISPIIRSRFEITSKNKTRSEMETLNPP